MRVAPLRVPSRGLPPEEALAQGPNCDANADAILRKYLKRAVPRIPDDPVLVGELQAFESSNTATGMTRYEAAGGRDDTVIALAMAYAAVDGGMRGDESRIITS